MNDILEGLTAAQCEAVTHKDGPMLVLAGAGSGKTRVVTRRIAYLLSHGVWPSQILAMTFTNKAAREMQERIAALINGEAPRNIGTFHGCCARFLRHDIELLNDGRNRNFTIYDDGEQQTVIKRVLKNMGQPHPSGLSPSGVQELINNAKAQRVEADVLALRQNYNEPELLGLVAKNYEAEMCRSNAVDFEDLLFLMVKILESHPEVRELYHNRFRYLLIDEYQDTNNLQYLLASLLAGRYENICVVGDDDQSIYKFRGATIENILNFEENFPGARLIRLEQNYRSTPQILDAANAVIRQNKGRKGKKLWTRNPGGTGITVKETADENEEANYVAARIFALSPPARFRDFAVLYRTNAQSNALERSFKFNAIPYRIIGGTRFFDRAEVKDMLAYLQLINNRADDLRLNRIVNNPPRGIGAKTLETVRRLAENQNLPLYLVLADAYHYPALEKNAAKLTAFCVLIEECAALLDSLPLPEFYDALVEKVGYAAMLEAHNDVESRTRLENVRELRSSLVTYMQNHPEDASLHGFLEEIALYTDIEQYDAEADAVVMMTIHTAKGLEFPHVFLVGAEDGLFPSLRSIGEAEDLEEERRLCYVAITRAKETLTITHARQRMLYGKTTVNRLSRFVRDIPPELLDRPLKPARPAQEARMVYDDLPFSERGSRWEPGSSRGSGYQSAKPRYAPPAAPKAAPVPEYRPGDTVLHNAFGRGMVLTVTKMGSDALLEVAFDEKGTKKLLAKTASAHMKKL